MKGTMDIPTEWNSFLAYAAQYLNFKPIALKPWKKANTRSAPAKHGFLSPKELEMRQESNSDLIRAAQPYIQILSLGYYQKPHFIALMDEGGWILCSCGNMGDLPGFANGFNWREEYTGINAVGNSLNDKQPIFIYDVNIYEHPETFCCFESPIKINNDISGSLNIFVPADFARPEYLIMGLACADSIGNSVGAAQIREQISQMEKVIATGSLLASTVHDIKNPLTVIRGMGQLGSLIATTRKEGEYFDKIVEQVDNLTKMLNDFIGVFGNDEYITCSPAVILKEIFEEIQPLCNVQNITLKLHASNYLPCYIQPGLFKRALHNLIKNAVQALPDGGVITVRIRRISSGIRLSLADNGPGIPLDIQDHIFDPFVKGSNHGTGLGLFMVNYVITKLHHGKIWFDSGSGRGTTFHIELPVCSRTQYGQAK